MKCRGNTKTIERSYPKHKWDFPGIDKKKQSRVFTKHYSNLSLILHPNHYTLLTWLIYQSLPDNTITYSTQLLRQYAAAVKLASAKYKSNNPCIFSSPPNTRKYFKYLIEQSLLFPTSESGVYMINPSLTHHRTYAKTEHLAEFARQYSEMEYLRTDGSLKDFLVRISTFYSEGIKKYWKPNK